MARFQIQKADRNGDFDDIFRANFADLDEAIKMAKHWARCNPNCDWGVRVVDTDYNNNVLWEN